MGHSTFLGAPAFAEATAGRLGGPRPLRLAAASIARLVYNLYGLTASEIAIVRGGGG